MHPKGYLVGLLTGSEQRAASQCKYTCLELLNACERSQNHNIPLLSPPAPPEFLLARIASIAVSCARPPPPPVWPYPSRRHFATVGPSYALSPVHLTSRRLTLAHPFVRSFACPISRAPILRPADCNAGRLSALQIRSLTYVAASGK